MSSYITKSNHQRLGLVRVTNTHRKYSPRLNEIYKDAYFRACIDELNNIYVALTRPKYELYIFIPRKSGISFNKARCLIPQEFKARGEKRRYQSQKVKKERSILKISPSHYADWIKFLKDELVEASTIRNREKIMQGNLMHFVLSQIGNLQKQFKDKAIKEAIENTKNKYPFIDNFVPLEEKAKGLIDLRRMKPFFYISDGEVYQEKEVVNNFGETKRIDRLIVKEKEVWVIDYKSSPGYEEQYKQQVIGYIKIIRELYPHHTIKGFIIYLDELRVEEIDRC